ncbi:hypothetical protein K32_34930 [Kaistia sp. 32K]|nr:hypothetical protein K32_34930 [Kaistia sp. 32K]
MSSYDKLVPTHGHVTQANIHVDSAAVLSAKTVRIVPTTFSARATQSIAKAEDRALVTNTLDRAMCVRLSDRFEIVAENQPADLTVHAVVTNVIPTDAGAAALSTVASLGSSVVLPVGVPRLPIGLGGLSVEAEAIGKDGTQKAGIVWARGANSFANKARVSRVGDAYSLAASFGNDFSKILLIGKSPFGGGPSLPPLHRVRSGLGGQSKYAACEAFGRAPGLPGLVGGELGLPPAWTDKVPEHAVARSQVAQRGTE